MLQVSKLWKEYKEWRWKRRLLRALDKARTLHCRYGHRYYVLSLKPRHRGYKFLVANSRDMQRWRDRGYLRGDVTIHQLKERAIYKTR